MRGDWPNVSIIIPTRNRAALLAETLGSLREQSCEAWEAVVVDDGSTDESQEMVARLAGEDKRIRALSREGEKTGAQACRNQGLAAARGELVIFLDSDDLLGADCLQQRVAAMEAHPELDFVVSPCQLFAEHPGDVDLLWNGPSRKSDLDRLLALDIPWQTAGPTWRREALRRVGPWDEEFLSWQDWEFHTRALLRGLRYGRLSRADCFWRMPGQNRLSIGTHALSAAHLSSHERMVGKIVRMAEEAGALTEERRRGLGGVLFFLARLWPALGGEERANECWDRARVWQLVGDEVYWSGRLYLSIPSRKLQRWLLALLRGRGWRFVPQLVEDCRGGMWKAPARASGEHTEGRGARAEAV
jgi:hypothetical protein